MVLALLAGSTGLVQTAIHLATLVTAIKLCLETAEIGKRLRQEDPK